MHQYPDPYQIELRRSIALYENTGIDNIICGNGASELIMAAVHAVRPQKALLVSPCYSGYETALRASEAATEFCALDESRGFLLDERILEHITYDTDMVFLADPNNPNGALISRDLMDRILIRCSECGAVLLLDECFLPLTGRSSAADDAGGCILHIRAFTKTFAVPGIRIGYMISSDSAMLDRIRKHVPEWNVSRIAEQAGAAAAEVLADTDYLSRSVDMIRSERSYLTGELRNLGIKVYPSDVNYMLLRSDAELCDRLLERGVLVRKCANFRGLDSSYIRIAVRNHDENAELVSILRSILQ